jgi:[acyl-carrier-protein] S-malonyltransferase
MTAAVVFPGQGSQFAGMCDPWVKHEAAKEVLDHASAVIGRDVVAGSDDEDALASTDFVQPAILALDVAAFRVLQTSGASFVGAAGHSLGEFAALVAAGVLGLADALEVVAVRGRAMQAASEERPGTMSALLGVGPERAAALCDDARGGDVLTVANENSSQQVVISGSVAAIERAEALCAERKIRSVRLKVAGAFHSPLMQPAVEPLEAAIDRVELRPPAFPIASNVTGELVEDPALMRDLLKRHVVSSVRWERCMQALRRAGADVFVEAGPGDVLTRLAKRVVPGAQTMAVASPDDAVTFGAMLG